MKQGFCLLLFAASAMVARAAGTTTWEMNSYQDFLNGRFSGVSLSRDGRLTLAPRVETVFSSDQPVIWSAARSTDGTLYVGTGHRGRVFRVDKSGRGSVYWTADEPEVFAVAVDRHGVLYAATSPKGKVYRIEKGKAAEFFSPNTTYIWSLAFGKDGALYVGAGDPGKIFRVEPSGKGEVYYETGQSHVTSLALDRDGLLLAGTEPNGILYRVRAKGKAFVLYDADLPEIRAISTTSDGTIYAAAMGGGSVGRSLMGSPATRASSGRQQAGATSITVTEDDAQGGVEIKPKSESAKSAQAAVAQVTTQFSPVVDLAGVEKSALFKISPDNTVEKLWSSKEENVYDLVPSGGDLVFSTDGQGRIYRLRNGRKATLLVQTNEGEVTRLLSLPGELLATTGDLGMIFRLGESPGTKGSYQAPVHDAGTVAHWGRLTWRTDPSQKGRVVFYTRAGNSSRPDATWSDWSEPLSDSNGAAVSSPNARYVQWKAEFSAAEGNAPVLENVTLAYLPQNTPPVLKSIQVTSQAATSAAAPKPAAAQPAASAFSITVTDTGEAAPATSAGTPTQTLSALAGRQMQISWQAEDPDGDKLVYALYFRGEEEREWKLVKSDLYQNSFTLDGDVLADGRYFFRVTASDLPGNPPAYAREAELVSAPVLIDNTPPLVTAAAPRRTGAQVEIDVAATDAASALRRAEYSLDAGAWTPMQSVDGVIDSPHEDFLLRLNGLSPGEHLVVIRVYDAADNAGLTKVVLR